MQVMHKLLSTLLVAFFMAFSGAAVAASGVTPDKSQSLTGTDSGTVQQTPAPDCKKDPTDPRCKDRK